MQKVYARSAAMFRLKISDRHSFHFTSGKKVWYRNVPNLHVAPHRTQRLIEGTPRKETSIHAGIKIPERLS